MPSWFSFACKSQVWTSFSNFIFNIVMLAAWNQQWQECLYHGNCKMLQIRTFFFFFGPDGQFFKFTNILLPTYHSLKITLVKVTNDHKFATSNRHLFSFYLTPQPHRIQLIMSSFLKCFPQFNSKASLPWFSNYFTDHFFLVPWPISFYLFNL